MAEAIILEFKGAGEKEYNAVNEILGISYKDASGVIQHLYAFSSGKPSTPTITGHYSFYRQEPGYNSEGMYYSFYWHNGYAVHGYHEVPTYAASHGCVRTFIADQPRIYEQLHFGESIFVF